MSECGPAWQREEELWHLSLSKPMKIRVVADVGGVSIFGKDELRGYTAAGSSYDQALAIFVDALLEAYVRQSVVPAAGQSLKNRDHGRQLRAFFWKRGLKDEERT